MAGRRNESPEKKAMRELMKNYHIENPIMSAKDINAVMRDMSQSCLKTASPGYHCLQQN